MSRHHSAGSTRVHRKLPRDVPTNQEHAANVLGGVSLVQREHPYSRSPLGETSEISERRARERLERHQELWRLQKPKRLVLAEAHLCRVTQDDHPETSICRRYCSGKDLGDHGICAGKCGAPETYGW